MEQGKINTIACRFKEMFSIEQHNRLAKEVGFSKRERVVTAQRLFMALVLKKNLDSATSFVGDFF